MAEAAVQPKEKTKAKRRYLKRKKERRKTKRHAKSDAAVSVASVQDDKEQTNCEDDSVANHVEDAIVVDSMVVPDATGKRPRKRRKMSHDNLLHDVSENTSPPDEAETAEKRLPSPAPTSLPRFEPPILPDASSTADLALQGVDRALAQATIIDAKEVLPIPVAEDDDGGTRLSARTRRRLHDLGITELFAVQTALLPSLLPSGLLRNGLYIPYNPPSDVCVSAPTGSGKTLAYVLPIIETLSGRIVTRLRALIVVPTRDLVAQVKETFEVLAKSRGLKICTATGQHSFAHEQAQLVADRTSVLRGGSSKVDILICTPGRLIDHLKGTPNFSLQHLRFLVIDEADRLLAQSFQGWLAQVLAATKPSSESPPGETVLSSTPPVDVLLPLADAVAPSFEEVHSTSGFPIEIRESSCQKLLFSATLTQDPGKIAALQLHDPKYYVVQSRGTRIIEADAAQEDSGSGLLNVIMEKFSMPHTLTEHMTVCDSAQKPLVFIYLVHVHNIRNALVFTKSAESTARLVHLFGFFEQERSKGTANGADAQLTVRAYSSDLAASERKSILEKFKSQEIHILVCSDLISRGIDISHVSHVVSYDAPVDMRKYVHRVGRTARAGRTGDAWTLVEEQEARSFKNMMKSADHLDRLQKVKVREKEFSGLMGYYRTALEHLKDAYAK